MRSGNLDRNFLLPFSLPENAGPGPRLVSGGSYTELIRAEKHNEGVDTESQWATKSPAAKQNDADQQVASSNPATERPGNAQRGSE